MSPLDPFWRDVQSAYDHIVTANVVAVSIQRGDKEAVVKYDHESGEVHIHIRAVEVEAQMINTGMRTTVMAERSIEADRGRKR